MSRVSVAAAIIAVVRSNLSLPIWKIRPRNRVWCAPKEVTLFGVVWK